MSGDGSNPYTWQTFREFVKESLTKVFNVIYPENKHKFKNSILLVTTTAVR